LNAVEHYAGNHAKCSESCPKTGKARLNNAQKELLKIELEKFTKDIQLADRTYNTCTVESFNNSLTCWIDKRLKCNKESYQMRESFALLHFNNGEDWFKPLLYDLINEELTKFFIMDPNDKKVGENQMVSKITNSIVKLNEIEKGDLPSKKESTASKETAPKPPATKQPKAPSVKQPKAPGIKQPKAPRVKQPKAPATKQPKAPSVKQPKAKRQRQSKTKLEDSKKNSDLGGSNKSSSVKKKRK